jgi:hypothetical protein
MTEYKGFQIHIDQDEDSENPLKDWDTGFELIAGGSFTHLSTAKEIPDSYIKKWTVYGYSHSGLCVSLTPYNDRFDSGIFGTLYQIEPDENFGDVEKQAEDILKTFNSWLSGEVYGYRVVLDEEEIDI